MEHFSMAENVTLLSEGRKIPVMNDPIIYRYGMRIVKQDGPDENLSRRMLPLPTV
jgi:hypothetical protein